MTICENSTKPGGATIGKHSYTYDTSGNIATWKREAPLANPTGLTRQFDSKVFYDRADQVSSVIHTPLVGSSVVESAQHYVYDAAGNIASRQVETPAAASTMVPYTHNALNQLTGIGGSSGVRPVTVRGSTSEPAKLKAKTGAVSSSWKNARMLEGNRFEADLDLANGANSIQLQAKDGSGNQSNYSYALTLAAASSKSPTYDADGNMTSDGERNFEWDSQSRLTKIISNSIYANTVEFKYNGLGQRSTRIESQTIGANTTKSYYHHLYDGIHLLDRRTGNASADSSTIDRRYFSQGEQRKNGALWDSYYYTRDHLGSLREVVKSDGTLAVRYDYDPYGKRSVQYQSSTYAGACDLGYTGHITLPPSPYATQAELVLTFYRAYAPELGRWLSADPLGEAGGLNLYGYVLGNPINSWDPLGLICVGDKYSKEMLGKVESTILGRQLANAVRAAEKNAKRSILIRHDPSGRSRFIFNDITLGKNGEYQDPSGNWHPFTSDQILVHELQHALDSLNNELKQHSDNKKCSPGMQDGAEERAVKRENQYLAELLRALRKDYISTRP